MGTLAKLALGMMGQLRPRPSRGDASLVGVAAQTGKARRNAAHGSTC